MPVSAGSPLDRPGWPKTLVGGKTFLESGAHKYEWMSVHDPGSEYDLPLTGLRGIMISPEVSGIDNPFVHPFGNEDEAT